MEALRGSRIKCRYLSPEIDYSTPSSSNPRPAGGTMPHIGVHALPLTYKLSG